MTATRAVSQSPTPNAMLDVWWLLVKFSLWRTELGDSQIVFRESADQPPTPRNNS